MCGVFPKNKVYRMKRHTHTHRRKTIHYEEKTDSRKTWQKLL